MKYSSVALVALIAALSAPAAFAQKAQPLNAGKNGFKSNAGAGNGGELVLTDTTVVSGTNYTTNEQTTIQNLTTTTTPVDSVTKTATGTTTEQRTLPNKKVQTRTVTVYEVVTVSGGITTTTYEEVVTVDVYTPQTQVETFTDVDPGRSGQHNKAPEVAGDVVETPLDPIFVGTEEVSRETVTNTTDNTVTTTTTETETGEWGGANK
jgi:hypothetical protein